MRVQTSAVAPVQARPTPCSVVDLSVTPGRIHRLYPSLSRDDRADCSQAFAVYILQNDLLLQTKRRTSSAFASRAYLSQAACNFTRNFCRSRSRLARHEVRWPQQTDEQGVTSDKEFTAATRTCDAWLHQQEARWLLCTAIQKLTPLQQSLLTRYFFCDQTYEECAAATGSTPNAVRMTIVRALKRLRGLLTLAGYTEENMTDYLREISKMEEQTGKS